MEVVVQSPPQSPNLDNFNNNLNNNRGTMSSSSPYPSPPSSPRKRLGEFYLSAPSSPSRISQLFGGEFDYFDSTVTNTTSVVNDDDGDDGFAFFLSNETKESYSRSAEELFYGGKIKPLEAAEGRKFQIVEEDSNKVFKNSQPKKNNDSHRESEHRRGRDRTPSSSSSSTILSSSNSSRRVTRSHSPYRTPQWEQQNQEQEQEQPISNKEGSIRLTSSNSSKGSSSSSSKRWRLRDLLLFRSASEGRGSTKDQFKSILYNNNKNKHEEVNKISSFRSIDLNSSSSSSLRRKGHVSAHELHYAMKRAESEDMKKRTFLPYKKGILGRLSGFGI